jgi:putative heme transporter
VLDILRASRAQRLDESPTWDDAAPVPAEERCAMRPLWRHAPAPAASDGEPVVEVQVLELDAVDLQRLSTVFTPPPWLRDLGRASWLLVGALLVVIGLAWLLATTAVIVNPVIGGAIVAVVFSPVVDRMSAHMHRGIASALVLLALVACAVVIGLLVIGGITSQEGAIAAQAASGVDKLRSWLESVGVSNSGAQSAADHASSDVPNAISTLVHGAVHGIKGLASLAFGLSFAALSIFFLLKDGPSMRRWVEGHLGLPLSVAETITGGTVTSLRGYFKGVTIVAAFNGIVVSIGALILGVPLAGTIGVVSFVTAYVPYIGAFVAGAFAVLLALGAQGTTVALIMLVIVILANGLLQNIVQPFAMGAALDLHPLVVLVVTISAGCLFGGIGLILAAPLLSAAVHITRDLAKARAAALDHPDGTMAQTTPSG